MKIISKDKYEELEKELAGIEAAISKTSQEFDTWIKSLSKETPSQEEYLNRSSIMDGYNHCQRTLVARHKELAEEMNEIVQLHALAEHLQQCHPERPLA